MRLVWNASDDGFLRANDTRRGIPARSNRFGVIEFNYLPIIDICTNRQFNCVDIGA